jgi:hypothetical protein
MGNFRGRIHLLHKVLAPMPGSAVVATAAVVEGLAAVGAVLGAVGWDMVGVELFVVGREVVFGFAVAVRGCTFVEKGVLVAGGVVAVVVGLGCCRRSSSLRFRHRILSMQVLGEDKIAEVDIAGWRPVVGVAAMIAGRRCWATVVATSSGMVVMVVALEDIDHVIVRVLDMAVAVLVGSLPRSAIAVCRMGRIELRCLCNSSRLLVHSGRQTEYWGIGSTSDAV